METKKSNKTSKARLFFSISESFQVMTPCVKFENSYRSDYSPVILYCKINNSKRGRGFWKFNNSVLTDKDYVNIVKKTINDVKMQYSCPVYNADNLLNIIHVIQFTIKDQTFMDILLTEIRGENNLLCNI